MDSVTKPVGMSCLQVLQQTYQSLQIYWSALKNACGTLNTGVIGEERARSEFVPIWYSERLVENEDKLWMWCSRSTLWAVESYKAI